MSEKREKIFDAITHIREDLIEDAQNCRFHKKSAGWKGFASLAASIVLIVSIGFLSIVPRGCGSSSSGGADSSAPVSTDSIVNNAEAPQGPASSEESPSTENTGGSPGSEPGDIPGTDTPETNGQSDGSALHQLTGVIIELQDGGLLVETVDSHDQYLVSTALIDYAYLAEGDWITVTWDGFILTTNPPIISNVKSIELIDPAE